MGPPTPQQPPDAGGTTLPAPPTGDLLAVVGLVVGSLVLPVIGWLVGVLLLWRSRTWTRSEKLLGTLVWPGGLLVPLALPFLPLGGRLLASPGLTLAAITLLVVAPMAVGGWLLQRARTRAAVTRR